MELETPKQNASRDFDSSSSGSHFDIEHKIHSEQLNLGDNSDKSYGHESQKQGTVGTNPKREELIPSICSNEVLMQSDENFENQRDLRELTDLNDDTELYERDQDRY